LDDPAEIGPSSADTTAIAARNEGRRRRRNPVLAEAIREGLGSLHQTAAFIQQSKHTNRSIFGSSGEEKTGGGGGQRRSDSHRARLESEGHRLRTVIDDCLDEMCRTADSSLLAVGGEPIAVVRVDVRPSMQHAKVYWTLPPGVILDLMQNNNNASIEKTRFASSNSAVAAAAADDDIRRRLATLERLQASVHATMTEDRESALYRGLGKLRSAVRARCRGYYPPKLQWEPAPIRVMLEEEDCVLRDLLFGGVGNIAVEDDDDDEAGSD